MAVKDCIWISARYETACAECEEIVGIGDRAVWDTREHKIYCGGCGEEVAGEDPKAARLFG